MRRFVRCRNCGGGGSCDYFEWVDDSLDERVRSMVVGLMMSNDTMAVEIKRLENDFGGLEACGEEIEGEKSIDEAEVVCVAEKVEIIFVFCNCVHFACCNVHWVSVRAI